MKTNQRVKKEEEPSTSNVAEHTVPIPYRVGDIHSLMTSFLTSENVIKLEILWTLKVFKVDSSFISIAEVGQLFAKISVFSDRVIAKKMLYEK